MNLNLNSNNIKWIQCKKHKIKIFGNPKTDEMTLDNLLNIMTKFTHVYFFDYFAIKNEYFTNKEIISNLPSNITYLYIGGNLYGGYNESLDNLPNSITTLIIGHAFNKSIDNLPNNLIKLSLGHNFSKPIDNLPSKLKVLHFGFKFSQSVDNLPLTLKKITFGDYFNKPVNKLPDTIQILNFGHNFNQSIDNLPSSLISLTLGCEFNLPLDRLPLGIKKIKLKCSFYNNSFSNLPNTLETINFCPYKMGGFEYGYNHAQNINWFNKNIMVDLKLKKSIINNILFYNKSIDFDNII